MIVLDASVLIAFLDAEDAHHDAAERLLEREIERGFSANPLTLAQVLVGPARIGRLDVALTAFRELEIVELPFPAATAVELARLRVRTGLRMPDCCVLVTAQEGAASVASFDAALTRAATELGLTTITS